MEDDKVPDLSPAELTVYQNYLALCNPTGTGIVTPQMAVTFLSKSSLPQETLSKVECLMIDMAGCR